MKSVYYTETFSHTHIHSLGLKWKMSHTQYWHGCPVLHSTWLISLFHLLWFMVSDDRPLGCYRWTECLSNPSKWQTHPHSTSLSNKTQLTLLMKEHKPWNHMSAHMHTAYTVGMKWPLWYTGRTLFLACCSLWTILNSAKWVWIAFSQNLH